MAAPKVLSDLDDIDKAAREVLVVDDNLTASENLDVAQQGIVEGTKESPGYEYQTHKPGKYFLPSNNDETERKRLDFQHHMMFLVFDKRLHLAPISEKTVRALDVGAGTGAWTIDFARQYPQIEILGVDLQLVQPEGAPTNCHFETHDFDDPWDYPHPFSYIHGRALMSCMTDAAKFMRSCFSSLEPGGYLELQDGITPWRAVDNSLEGTDFGKWGDYIQQGAAKLGRDTAIALKYREYMEAAGFTNIQVEHFQVPINPWPKDKKMKEIGRIQCDNFTSPGTLERISMVMLEKGFGMEHQEVLSFLEDVTKDFRDTRVHAYMPILVVLGQKPE